MVGFERNRIAPHFKYSEIFYHLQPVSLAYLAPQFFLKKNMAPGANTSFTFITELYYLNSTDNAHPGSLGTDTSPSLRSSTDSTASRMAVPADSHYSLEANIEVRVCIKSSLNSWRKSTVNLVRQRLH